MSVKILLACSKNYLKNFLKYFTNHYWRNMHSGVKLNSSRTVHSSFKRRKLDWYVPTKIFEKTVHWTILKIIEEILKRFKKNYYWKMQSVIENI